MKDQEKHFGKYLHLVHGQNSIAIHKFLSVTEQKNSGEGNWRPQLSFLSTVEGEV